MYLDTEHSGLNKFRGPDDENFLLVWPEIDRMTKNAPQRIEEHYICKFQLLHALNFLLFRASLIIAKHMSQVPK